MDVMIVSRKDSNEKGHVLLNWFLVSFFLFLLNPLIIIYFFPFTNRMQISHVSINNSNGRITICDMNIKCPFIMKYFIKCTCKKKTRIRYK